MCMILTPDSEEFKNYNESLMNNKNKLFEIKLSINRYIQRLIYPLEKDRQL